MRIVKINKQESLQKISEERATYQKMLNPMRPFSMSSLASASVCEGGDQEVPLA
jgi:hypothetical protein